MLPITFLSDYGFRDHFVGTCHGVIERIAPGTTVIDIGHGVPACALITGAVALRSAIPYMPIGVHLAVVDPGVGSERGAIVLRTADERLFVGPDNGLLTPAADLCGGIVAAFDIRHAPTNLQPASNTFQGRDIFAPAAAELSKGTDPATIGEEFNPENVVALKLPAARIGADALEAHVLSVDQFGNIQLDAQRSHLEELAFEHGKHLELMTRKRGFPAVYASTFADVAAGEMLLFEDSSRLLAIAVNQDSAAEWLAVDAGDTITIRAF